VTNEDAHTLCHKIKTEFIRYLPSEHRPRCRVIRMETDLDRNDLWVVMIGLPFDAPWRAYEDAVCKT
jgi:hypothetical protein